MTNLSGERKRNLIDFIEQSVVHSDRLHPRTRNDEKFARSVWWNLLQVCDLVERQVAKEEDRKLQFLSYVKTMPRSLYRIAKEDYQQVIAFVEQDCRELNFQEVKFVIGWVQRLLKRKGGKNERN